MLLNQYNLSSVEFTAGIDDCRTEIQALYVNPLKIDKDSRPYTVATDGHILLQVDLPPIEDDDFPIGVGMKSEGEGEKLCSPGYSLKRQPILLEAKAVRQALKNLKSSWKANRYLPILHNVQTFINGDKAQLVNTDLKTVNRVTSFKEGRYPNYEAVKPTDEPALTILVDAGKLADLAHWFNKFNPDYKGRGLVTIEIRSDNSPLVFKAENQDTGQCAYGLLMPCRKSEA